MPNVLQFPRPDERLLITLVRTLESLMLRSDYSPEARAELTRRMREFGQLIEMPFHLNVPAGQEEPFNEFMAALHKHMLDILIERLDVEVDRLAFMGLVEDRWPYAG